MKKFITMLGMPNTEQLGSQMSQFATLTHIANRSGHRVVFFEEHCQIGRGLRLHRNFDNLPFELISVNSLAPDDRTYSVFQLNWQIAVESAVFQLNPAQNYNFQGLFCSYKYWWPIREQVKRMYAFRPDVLERARDVVGPVRKPGREVVSVHVRRTDYLTGMNVNVNGDYFNAAFAQFDDSKMTYLVFSDDIAWCKEAFSNRTNLVFAEGNEPIIDMCAMSLCDHNISVNSTFSFWGAFLNKNPNKRMIAPARMMKQDTIISHMNYCYLPDEFLLIDAGNV